MLTHPSFTRNHIHGEYYPGSPKHSFCTVDVVWSLESLEILSLAKN